MIQKLLKTVISTLYFLTTLSALVTQAQEVRPITIAILAKDKAHTLPLFLKCIENQTWPSEKTYLYIKTNNNNDNTVEILEKWIETVKDRYPKIYFDCENVTENIEQFSQHTWNSVRFKVLGKIRGNSIKWAIENDSDYFVVDCDNFIKAHTIESLASANLPIVAPFLKLARPILYSNYHADVDDHGYFKGCQLYYDIFNQIDPGCHKVPVVHCSYFIQNSALPFMSYDDNSYRYEYVIFSDVARKNNIDQYIDNRDVYGLITFAETAQELEQETTVPGVLSWTNNQ
ncbi:MAG: glycosyltransferase family 2 protein [Candidatus Dependentiae bacterium]|nr:glycosyltransferase family 2 protein [Candidatus Dependentiae bacterium]